MRSYFTVNLLYYWTYYLSGNVSKLTWDVASSTTMRKWKWLTVNDFVCSIVISAALEFLNLCQNGWRLC
jgi:hypothetical protein